MPQGLGDSLCWLVRHWSHAPRGCPARRSTPAEYLSWPICPAFVLLADQFLLVSVVCPSGDMTHASIERLSPTEGSSYLPNTISSSFIIFQISLRLSVICLPINQLLSVFHSSTANVCEPLSA